MDFQIQLTLPDGIKKDIFGKDGNKIIQMFHYFQLTEQSILNKTFKAQLETAILSHHYHHVLNFLPLLRKPFLLKQKTMLQYTQSIFT